MRQLIIKLYKVKIFKRIIPSVLKIITNINKTKNISIKHNEFLLNLNLNNPIDREIYLKDNYENECIEQLKKIIKSEKILFFIDVGAHIGFYSLNIGKEEKINVYSFEPIINNFKQLEENIKINKYKNIKCFNIALSNEISVKTMWVSDEKKTGGYSIYKKNDVELKKYEEKKIYNTEVKTNKGDNLIKIKDSKIAIKIDVERSEKCVIEGFNNLFHKNKIYMQIEIFDQMKEDIHKLLSKYNFKFINKIGKDYYYKNY
jgi:FkbM family methyltransferase